MIDVAPRHLGIIRKILKKYVPDLEVRAFGSRVTLPFRVEIMDWQTVSDDFRKIIQAQYGVIQTAKLSS